MRADEAREASRIMRWAVGQTGLRIEGGVAYQLALVLDREGGVGEDGGQVNLVLFLDFGRSKSRLPLVCKGASSAVLFQDGNLLAGILERVETRLELLLVLFGVLCADEDLDGDLAALEGLEVGS